VQKTFLSKNPPSNEDMPSVDARFKRIENHEMDVESLTISKIRKIMRRVAVLPIDRVPRDDEFKFRDRAAALADTWGALLHAASEQPQPDVEGSPGAPTRIHGADEMEVIGVNDSVEVGDSNKVQDNSNKADIDGPQVVESRNLVGDDVVEHLAMMDIGEARQASPECIVDPPAADGVNGAAAANLENIVNESRPTIDGDDDTDDWEEVICYDDWEMVDDGS